MTGPNHQSAPDANQPDLVDPIEQIRTSLLLRDLEKGEIGGGGDIFDPWELFPCFYGSYSSEFDEVALRVLNNLLVGVSGPKHGENVAHEMFREVLCTSDLCGYGMSPRTCWPEPEFKELLPVLILKWLKYAEAHWEEYP
jgi:hypothetical protein